MPDWASDKEKRLAKIQEAMAALEADAKLVAEEERRIEADKQQRRNAEGRKKPGKPAAPLPDEPDPKAQHNFTDPDSRGTRWSHRVESNIGLGVAGIGLNGIPAVNDLPVLYEHGISARMPVILETNASHPGPALERVYPAKSRYCECVVGCAIFEGVFEVFGDEVVVAWIRFGRWHLVGQSNVAAPWQQGNQEQERRSGSVPRRTCPLPFS